MTYHPITPPPELVEQWTVQGVNREAGTSFMTWFATQAARWGADQELEACCQALYARYDIPNCIFPKMAEDMREWLRAARRPQPPSLKEQALEILGYPKDFWSEDEVDTIRRALEALPE